MNLYPGMSGKMGRWNYFIVKMTMRELADSVRFASDVYEDRTLDEAIQRVLNESRVKKEIVTYLIRQPDRFFSSIVVAALGGSPQWYPVAIDDDERFSLFKGDARLNETFGVLSFDGTQSYYALDGQHRLSAIKTLVDKNSDAYIDAPEGFLNEEISVIVVVPSEAEDEQEFFKRYRRLFGNLNRYAKAMDQVTNIIMDEDDVIAIITRRLITDHVFFKSIGKQKESARIKMRKGKNLTRSDTFFTSLETLYAMNIALLQSRVRKTEGWGANDEKLAEYVRFRPDDEEIDSLYNELALYWDALIEEVAALSNEPSEMRDHAAETSDDGNDLLIFWPIGQEMFAEIARDLLDFRTADGVPTAAAVKTALKGLGEMDWELHRAPWRYLLLVQDEHGDWKMRNEERADAVRVAKRIARWQLGIDELDADGVTDLRRAWESRLIPAQSEAEAAAMWREVEQGCIG